MCLIFLEKGRKEFGRETQCCEKRMVMILSRDKRDCLAVIAACFRIVPLMFSSLHLYRYIYIYKSSEDKLGKKKYFGNQTVIYAIRTHKSWTLKRRNRESIWNAFYIKHPTQPIISSRLLLLSLNDKKILSRKIPSLLSRSNWDKKKKRRKGKN